MSSVPPGRHMDLGVQLILGIEVEEIAMSLKLKLMYFFYIGKHCCLLEINDLHLRPVYFMCICVCNEKILLKIMQCTENQNNYSLYSIILLWHKITQK